MIERVLVLDAGSSSLKAVLFGGDGAVLASAEAGYAPPPAAHRQRPDNWWAAARAAITQLGGSQVDAIALTGTMENLITVDREGNAIGDAIVYSDPCGSGPLAGMRAQLDAIGAARILGNAPEPLMTAFKIAWLRDNCPDVFRESACFLLGAKDFLALRLTGRLVTDPVTATTTGLMDLARRDWSEALLAIFEIAGTKLPDILPATAVIGPVLPEAAADLGLRTADPIPVINGCGDAGATTLGSFCRESGDISLYLGTTGWLARVVAEEETGGDRPVYRLAHPSPRRLIEITPVLSAGAAAAWARGVLKLSEEAAEAALQVADKGPADLLFLPYLSGERSPFMDTDVRGAFLGLDAAHEAAALYYAVLEGVGFSIRANLDALDPSGAGRIRLVGGGARSSVWPQILADLLSRPLSVPASAAIATAQGGFLIAAEALGLPSREEPSGLVLMPRQQRRGRAERLAASFSEATGFARSLRLGDHAALSTP